MADTKISDLTAGDVSLDDVLPIVDDLAGTPATKRVTASRLLALGLHGTFQAVLTTQTGVPFPTADRTAQSTIYLTPFRGNRIGLYDGTRWTLHALTEISLALSALTSALPYDVFVYDNAGTLTLELTAWTNGTTRATALVLQDGVWVKTGATTRRYVGSIYTTSTTTTEQSRQNQLVFNAYNRPVLPLNRTESTDNWTYATASWRSANGSTSNRVGVMVGLAECMVELNVLLGCIPNTNGLYGQVGIGKDSVTVNGADANNSGYIAIANDALVTTAARMVDRPAVGYHYYQWLEYAAGATITFYATDGVRNGGISGLIN